MCLQTLRSKHNFTIEKYEINTFYKPKIGLVQNEGFPSIFGIELLQGDLHQHPQVHDQRLPTCGETLLALLSHPAHPYHFYPSLLTCCGQEIAKKARITL